MQRFYANTHKDLTIGAIEIDGDRYTFDGLAVSLVKQHIVKYGRWTELNQEIYEYAEQFGRDDFTVEIIFTYEDDD
jgi:hypothetical protein